MIFVLHYFEFLANHPFEKTKNYRKGNESDEGQKSKTTFEKYKRYFFYTCIILICVDHTLFIIRCSSSFIHFFAIFSFFILRPQLELNVYIAKNYPVQIRDSLF